MRGLKRAFPLVAAVTLLLLPSVLFRGGNGAWGDAKTVLLPSVQEPAATSASEKVLLLIQKGALLLERRFFTQATDHLETGVLLAPDNADAWYLLGRTYEARGLFAKAQRAYRKTVELDPTYPAFSRLLLYPAEGERQPLWDPSRPVRIEEIPVVVDGFVIDPTVAPTYIPPDPNLPGTGGESPAYTPPPPPEKGGPDEDDGTFSPQP